MIEYHNVNFRTSSELVAFLLPFLDRNRETGILRVFEITCRLHRMLAYGALIRNIDAERAPKVGSFPGFQLYFAVLPPGTKILFR